jgi:hypothetical protein
MLTSISSHIYIMCYYYSLGYLLPVPILVERRRSRLPVFVPNIIIALPPRSLKNRRQHLSIITKQQQANKQRARTENEIRRAIAAQPETETRTKQQPQQTDHNKPTTTNKQPNKQVEIDTILPIIKEYEYSCR